MSLAANVIPNGVKKRLLTDSQTRLIVVELQVVCDEDAHSGKVAVVVGVEELVVKRGNGFKQLVGNMTDRRCDLLRRVGALHIDDDP